MCSVADCAFSRREDFAFRCHAGSLKGVLFGG